MKTGELLVFLGLLFFIAVATVNTWIVFFLRVDYTGGMTAWSFFWFVVGCCLFFGGLNKED